MTFGEASAFRAPFLAATRASFVKGDERVCRRCWHGEDFRTEAELGYSRAETLTLPDSHEIAIDLFKCWRQTNKRREQCRQTGLHIRMG